MYTSILGLPTFNGIVKIVIPKYSDLKPLQKFPSELPFRPGYKFRDLAIERIHVHYSNTIRLRKKRTSNGYRLGIPPFFSFSFSVLGSFSFSFSDPNHAHSAAPGPSSPGFTIPTPAIGSTGIACTPTPTLTPEIAPPLPPPILPPPAANLLFRSSRTASSGSATGPGAPAPTECAVEGLVEFTDACPACPC
ncbi:hypothetical protein H0H92_006198 [Tricholoma furcatifolium]|nr:hypothetical protein H0H92_006198 [Tricholoma furcatifolium]